MKHISEKCRETRNTYFMPINFFFFENRSVYEIMWKNIVEPDRPQMTIWRMRIACWIPKAANTQHIFYLLHFPCNNGCMNPPHYYTIRTLPVLFCAVPRWTSFIVPQNCVLFNCIAESVCSQL